MLLPQQCIFIPASRRFHDKAHMTGNQPRKL
jgi:hypothetical protein